MLFDPYSGIEICSFNVEDEVRRLKKQVEKLVNRLDELESILTKDKHCET